MNYDQRCTPTPPRDDWKGNTVEDDPSNPHVMQLPDLAPGLVLEDDVLKQVRAAYEKIMGEEEGAFMTFEDREGQAEGDEGDEGGV